MEDIQEHTSSQEDSHPRPEAIFVAYHLLSYKIKLLLTIKVRIDRDSPEIDSVCSIWGESAQIHERENAELFGVEFVGNSDLSPP